MGLMDGLLIATSKMVTLRVLPVLYYSVPYLRMMLSVLELKIVCGWYHFTGGNQ
jgi:hypothetical protein